MCDSWNHLQWPLLDSPFRIGSSGAARTLYGRRFRSFVALWAEDFDTPLLTANRCNDLPGHVSIWAPISSSFSSVKTKRLRSFFLSSTEPVFLNFSTILYTVLLHGTFVSGYFLQNFRRHICHDAYFRKVLQMNTLCSTENTMSHTHYQLFSVTHKTWLSAFPLFQLRHHAGCVGCSNAARGRD